MLNGRGYQWELLDRAVAQAAAGAARVVVVEGAVGCGKSEFADTAAERAAGAGVLVLRAMGTPAESGIELGVVGQLVADAPPGTFGEDAGGPGGPSAVGGVGGGGGFWAGDAGAGAGAGGVQAMQAFCAQVLALAERVPVAVCVDDLHLADEASRRYLLHLARRARADRLLMVLTESVHERSDDPVPGTELLRAPGFVRVRLERLAAEEVAAVVAGAPQYADTEPPAQALERFTALSGGNPLLLRALLEDHRAALESAPAGDAGQLPTPGAAFTHAVWACLQRCGVVTLAVAQGLAVLDGLASVVGAAELASTTQAVARQAVLALGAAGLLDGVRWHPAARAVVLEGMDPLVRVACHRRAARFAFRSGAPVAEVAGQLLAAGHAGEEWAPGVLRTAADELLAGGDAAGAVRVLELALGAPGSSGAARAELAAALAVAGARVDPAAAEAALQGPVEALRAGTLDAAGAARLGRLLVVQGRVEEAALALDAVYAAGQPGAAAGVVGMRDAALQAPLDGLFAFPRWNAPDGADGALPAAVPTAAPAAAATAAAVAGRGSGGSAAALADRTARRGRPGSGLGEAAAFWGVPGYNRHGGAANRAELFLRGTALSQATLAPVLQAVRALLYLDGPLRALPWTQTYAEQALRQGAPGWRAEFALLRTEALLRQGDLAGAAEQAGLVRGQAAGEQGSLTGTWASALLARAYTAMGRPDEAARELARPLPQTLPGTVQELGRLQATGLHHLATNRYHAALCDFLDIGKAVRHWGLDRPLLLPWRTGAAEALLQLGEVRQAARMVAEQLEHADAAHPWTAGVSLRLKAWTGAPGERQAVLRRAVDELRRSGDRLELARAMADLGRVLKEAGEPGRANMVNRRAWHLAKACGADALQERILPGHVPAPAPAVPEAEAAGPRVAYTELGDRLSDSEKRVAMLAVHGHTNREIALKLYITVSTVEQHLTRVYRKLNITRRQDLPADLQLMAAHELA
ncbi:AAA family ATPase [Streptomyces sp. NPDC046866]|uniref:helix-turn-helix transcriptional regulator n=1 Tax=Streptomyces sp. NPDC046866 TaxID=3154921 RepID=UPI003456B5D0